VLFFFSCARAGDARDCCIFEWGGTHQAAYNSSPGAVAASMTNCWHRRRIPPAPSSPPLMLCVKASAPALNRTSIARPPKGGGPKKVFAAKGTRKIYWISKPSAWPWHGAARLWKGAVWPRAAPARERGPNVCRNAVESRSNFLERLLSCPCESRGLVGVMAVGGGVKDVRRLWDVP